MPCTLRIEPAVLFAALGLAVSAGAADPAVDFNHDIRPILSNACFRCHGPDPDERKGGTDGLRLDTPGGATLDLGGYAAIVPGDPAASELIKRVTSSDPDQVMPPKGAGRALSPKEIELLKTWIRQGAKYSGHWSYVKPVRPDVPQVRQTDWPQNPIDSFLLTRLEKEGLAPSSQADCEALIRRASIDLTGLPPALAEVDQFLADKSAGAYERLIDRLLAKETFGEHWAHMWLDLARYADSAGYADDPARTIWLYRDYVIKSLNANKPFDQFTIEQIAGDLLPNPTEEQLTATAFHRNTLTNNEGGTNDEEFRNVAIVDRVNTTFAVWMGTTMACAQCHAHKYDPISNEDYFRFFAIFNNTEDADRKDETPVLSIFTPEQRSQRTGWEQELKQLDETLHKVTPELAAARDTWDAEFPRDVAWRPLAPHSATAQSGAAAKIEGDIVNIPGGAKTDAYTLELPLPGGKLKAVRIEALPEASLPGQGPGLANGNFVITKASATLAPPMSQSLPGRYLRIEVPGRQKILSLAEVQVFHGTENIAPGGSASQSSTDYDGPPHLAIDGKTDGRYRQAKSTTHTAISADPWWELDLRSTQPVDRIVIWNRTDDGLGERLKDFHLRLLNDAREPVWEQTVATAPSPQTEFSLSGDQLLAFSTAVADYSQPGFSPEFVLKNPDSRQKGWAIGGQTGQRHTLTLIVPKLLEVAEGATLKLTIEQQSQHEQHTLGRFRISITDHPQASDEGRAPQDVLEALARPAPERTPEQSQRLTDYYLTIAPALEKDRKRSIALHKQLDDMQPITVPVCKELQGNQRRATRIQRRGNFLDLGEEVSSGLPAAFHPLAEGDRPDRLGVAHWLVGPDNPLTARVIANRYWEEIFGVGLVATSEEFGSQGDLPSHPELLDWLATELIRLNWDTKAFLKLLVTTAAYRQSSHVTPEQFHRDPENRLLARGPRFRLSAEEIRDQALFVSGLLSAKVYGPPVKPPQPAAGLNAAFGGAIDWQTSTGEDKYRRALYTTWRRSNPYPSMTTFDAPNREVCTLRRVRTNTPLQALVTLNDPVYIEASQALARRMMKDGGATPAERATYGFRLCLSRAPHEHELARLVRLYEQSLEKFQSAPDDARQLASDPLGPLPAELNPVEAAAWTVTANVLLNLDETLMKR